VLIPALRTVGNIVTGDDLQTQVMLISVILFTYVYVVLFLQTMKAVILGCCKLAMVSSQFLGNLTMCP
jgi:hypothetical protein